VIGASSGAAITLYIATLKTDLAKKIILISGQPYISSTTRNYITAKGPGTEDPKRLEYMIGTHGKVKGTLLLRQYWNFRKLYGDPAFTQDVLATIKAKTLIIHGDNDRVVPVSSAWRCINIFQKQLCGLFQMAVMDLFLIRRIKLISFAGFWNFFREIGKANEYAVAKHLLN
jgi:predicted esterase